MDFSVNETFTQIELNGKHVFCQKAILQNIFCLYIRDSLSLTNGDLYIRFQLPLTQFQSRTDSNSTFKIHTLAFKSAVLYQGLSKIL